MQNAFIAKWLSTALSQDQTSSWALMIEDVYKRALMIEDVYKRGMPKKNKCLSLPL